nr:MAG TPA: Rad50 zinc hook motif [Caudoviricetes sp.]
MVDEKYVVDINSTCSICGRELFAELKKMMVK